MRIRSVDEGNIFLVNYKKEEDITSGEENKLTLELSFISTEKGIDCFVQTLEQINSFLKENKFI